MRILSRLVNSTSVYSRYRSLVSSPAASAHSWTSNGFEDTEDLGFVLGGLAFERLDRQLTTATTGLVPPLTIFLRGGLGVGKSAFARGFLRGATGDERLQVNSPTFLLTLSYPLPTKAKSGKEQLLFCCQHIDLYRIKRKESFEAISVPSVFGPFRLPPPPPLQPPHSSLSSLSSSHPITAISLIEWPERLDPATQYPPPSVEWLQVEFAADRRTGRAAEAEAEAEEAEEEGVTVVEEDTAPRRITMSVRNPQRNENGAFGLESLLRELERVIHPPR